MEKLKEDQMINVIVANVIALCVYVFVLNNLWDVMPADISLLGRLLSFSLILVSPFIAYKLYKRNLDY
ncbi:MAG: hypothetical protein DIZ80_05500 [endosymbiont of Galathealinum brachiosum]|uniref:Uncharacterized protein n=1 Tax=endosymbiont of Galathealinum brachiosum TaxID=2200906 RepID=A0A370DK13_9GAMM|nr:MAG: hypothetical protein DIZ80_05500 [endosymbiont of Galathealinum brachiosum]